MGEDRRQYPPHCQMMRNALRQKDWQQDVIAAVMQQSRSTVNGILTGRQRLTARLAIDYGHMLQLSPEDLLREQGAWLLTILPNMDAKLAAIRLRAEMMKARIAGDMQDEIESLRKQRTAIDARIAHLIALLRGGN